MACSDEGVRGNDDPLLRWGEPVARPPQASDDKVKGASVHEPAVLWGEAVISFGDEAPPPPEQLTQSRETAGGPAAIGSADEHAIQAQSVTRPQAAVGIVGDPASFNQDSFIAVKEPPPATVSIEGTGAEQVGETWEPHPVLVFALIILLPTALLAVHYKLSFSGLVVAEAMDYAQLARNLIAGRGFETLVIRPLGLSGTGALAPQPELVHGPLFPFVQAVVFGVMGSTDRSAAISSALFYLLTLPVTYYLGCLLHTRTTGVLSAVLITASVPMLQFALQGLPVTLCAFLLTSIALCLAHIFREGDQASVPEAEGDGHPYAPPRLLLVSTGVLSGLLYLAEPQFVWIVPVVGVAVYRGLPNAGGGVLRYFGIPVAIILGGWMVRNGLVGTNPVFGLRAAEFSMNENAPYPQAYRLTPAGLDALSPSLLTFYRKVVLGATLILRDVPAYIGWWVASLGAIGLMLPFGSRVLRSTRVTMVGMALALAVGFCAMRVDPDQFLAFVPVLLVLATVSFREVWDRFLLVGRARAAAAVGILLLVFLPQLAHLTAMPRPLPLIDSGPATFLSRELPRTGVVLTDQPALTAWYANRRSIWIPAEESALAPIRRYAGDEAILYLTSGVTDYGPVWAAIYNEFFQANSSMRRAKMEGKKLPDIIGIPEQSSHPIAAALAGYQLVPTLAGPETSVVIAQPARSKAR